MHAQEMTCIVCPMGCQMTVTEENGAISVSGNACRRGEKYGIQEYTKPMRTVTTSIRLKGGKRPVVSCKTRDQIAKGDIPAVLCRCKKALATSPIKIGDVLIENAAGTGVDIVATSDA
ncbi:MAG: DUF1667 domain-containing protein [Christensenellales bacterium]